MGFNSEQLIRDLNFCCTLHVSWASFCPKKKGNNKVGDKNKNIQETLLRDVVIQINPWNK